MNETLNLKNVKRKVVSNINDLKASRDTTASLVKSRQAKKHLLEIREKLQKYIKVGNHNLNILQNDSSGKLRKVKEIAGSEIDKIRILIREIDSGLDSFRQKDRSTGSFNRDTNFMDSAEEKDPLQVTYQTIAFMDAERYGTAGRGSIVNYPKPALGVSANQHNCNIADKIRIGLSTPGRDGLANCRITIPKCFQNFCEGKG